MPESQPTDDDIDVPADATTADVVPGEAEDQAGEPDAPAKTHEELLADVEARRAATSARMDEAKGTARATSDDPTGRRARARAVGKATSDDPTGASARRASRTSSVPRPSKRTGGLDAKAARTAAARSGNPKKAAAAAEASRYTAPIPRSQIESPAWVGILMFSLLGLGMVVIFLTYVAWGGRPLALGVGLALILGGILTATQLR